MDTSPYEAKYGRPKPEVIELVKEKLSVLDWMRGFPAKERQLHHIAEAYASFAKTTVCKNSELGDQAPIDWLIREIGKTCDFFPTPIRARRLYCTRYKSQCMDEIYGDELSGIYLSEQALED